MSIKVLKILGVGIATYYEENRDKNTQVSRNKQGMMNRWTRLNHAVSKFAGCKAQIKERRESGLNDEDKKNRALQLYHQNEKANFTVCNVWEVLRNEQKWTSGPKNSIQLNVQVQN